MHENRDEIKMPKGVVFITPGRRTALVDIMFGKEIPLIEASWSADQPTDLAAFLEDMDALGFAIWRTPGTVFVFTGEVA